MNWSSSLSSKGWFARTEYLVTTPWDCASCASILGNWSTGVAIRRHETWAESNCSYKGWAKISALYLAFSQFPPESQSSMSSPLLSPRFWLFPPFLFSWLPFKSADIAAITDPLDTGTSSFWAPTLLIDRESHWLVVVVAVAGEDVESEFVCKWRKLPSAYWLCCRRIALLSHVGPPPLPPPPSCWWLGGFPAPSEDDWPSCSGNIPRKTAVFSVKCESVKCWRAISWESWLWNAIK